MRKSELKKLWREVRHFYNEFLERYGSADITLFFDDIDEGRRRENIRNVMKFNTDEEIVLFLTNRGEKIELKYLILTNVFFDVNTHDGDISICIEGVP